MNIANGLFKKDFSFSGSRLGIAAAVFAFGELLHFHYKFVHKLGKKYYLARYIDFGFSIIPVE